MHSSTTPAVSRALDTLPGSNQVLFSPEHWFPVLGFPGDFPVPKWGLRSCCIPSYRALQSPLCIVSLPIFMTVIWKRSSWPVISYQVELNWPEHSNITKRRTGRVRACKTSLNKIFYTQWHKCVFRQFVCLQFRHQIILKPSWAHQAKDWGFVSSLNIFSLPAQFTQIWAVRTKFFHNLCLQLLAFRARCSPQPLPY